MGKFVKDNIITIDASKEMKTVFENVVEEVEKMIGD